MLRSPDATDAQATGDGEPPSGDDDRLAKSRRSRPNLNCRELVHDLTNSLAGIAMLADDLIEATQRKSETTEAGGGAVAIGGAPGGGTMVRVFLPAAPVGKN